MNLSSLVPVLVFIFCLFAAILVVAFLAFDMVDKAEGLKKRLPWLAKFLEKKEAVPAFLLVIVLLLVLNGYELVTKETPDLPEAPRVTFQSADPGAKSAEVQELKSKLEYMRGHPPVRSPLAGRHSSSAPQLRWHSVIEDSQQVKEGLTSPRLTVFPSEPVASPVKLEIRFTETLTGAKDIGVKGGGYERTISWATDQSRLLFTIESSPEIGPDRPIGMLVAAKNRVEVVSINCLNCSGAPQASEDAERDADKRKRFEIRTKLGELLEKNELVKSRCIAAGQQQPPQFSCVADANSWLQEAFVFITQNMESSYKARFVSATGLSMSYGISDEATENAINALTHKSAAITEFIKEQQ
jgi:hypothetical protein